MEASKLASRSFLAAISRSRSCECQSASLSRIPIHLPTRQRPLPQKSFSTSTTRRRDATASPRKDSRKTSNAPPRSPPSSKQELKSYTRSIQKIIDGYSLKEELPPRVHESLVVAITNAEVRLEAPGAQPDSFAPLLKSLRGEVDPILNNSFGSSDVAQLIADVGKRKVISTQKESPKVAPKLPPNEGVKERRPMSETVAAKLDAALGVPKADSTRTERSEAMSPKPDSTFDEDLDSPRSTLDSVWNFLQRKDDPTRSSEPDPNLPMSTLERLGLAHRAQQDRQKQREVSLSLQDRLARSDDAFLSQTRSDNLRPALRLKPTLGRTVDVSGGFDVTRAFRTLEALCARNKVKYDLNKQRFHVRRGQMRKNLKMQRWRKLFKQGFLAECERVRRMRKQGW